MKKRRSKTRSGTSSRRAAALPKLAPIYVDESLSQHYLPVELRAANVTVYARSDKFSQGVTDPEWLTKAGKQGWIVLTKDKAIRHRQNELRALVNAGVRAFVLAAGEMTGQDQAALFRRILPKIRRFVAEMPAGPFVVRVARDGSCDVLYPENPGAIVGKRRKASR